METHTDDDWDYPSDAEEQFFDEAYCPAAWAMPDAHEVSGDLPVIKTDITRPSIRVFGVPELLEHILLMVADAAVEDANTSTNPRVEPFQTLSGICRVDSNFFHGITKGPKLARLLRSWEHADQQDLKFRARFLQTCRLPIMDKEKRKLEPNIDVSTATRYITGTIRKAVKVLPRHRHCPMSWLLQHLVPNNNKFISTAPNASRSSGRSRSPTARATTLFNAADDDEINKTASKPTLKIYISKLDCITNTPQSPRGKLDTFIASKMTGEKASWRNINATNGDALVIRIAAVTAPLYHDGSSIDGSYKACLAFEGNSTLGEVFDKYREVVERTAAEHWTAAQEPNARANPYAWLYVREPRMGSQPSSGGITSIPSAVAYW